MKVILSFIFLFSNHTAHAEDIAEEVVEDVTEDTPKNGIQGLICKMDYLSSKVFNSINPNSTSYWMAMGDEVSSETRIGDGDGGMGSSPANFFKVSSTHIDGKSFWQVAIMNGERKILGILTFPIDSGRLPNPSGMKATFPTHAFDMNDDDPAEFDILEVTCRNTDFTL